MHPETSKTMFDERLHRNNRWTTHRMAKHLPWWFQESAECRSTGRESVSGSDSFELDAPWIAYGNRSKRQQTSTELKHQTTRQEWRRGSRTEQRLSSLHPTALSSSRRTSRKQCRGWRLKSTTRCSSTWRLQSSCRHALRRSQLAFQGARKESLRRSSKHLD